MLYAINILWIIIINFLYNSGYFLLLFSILKDRTKYYVFKVDRFAFFNFFWLGDLVKSLKIAPTYLATKSHLVRELPQSCEMISKAINSGLIYCPAKKGTKHDGCFYDPKSGIITETVQFKMKEEGSSLISPACLSSWMKKYYNIDRLDIGFQSIEDLECNKGLLLKANKLLYAKTLNYI
jgi:hypothetical protein